MIYDLEVIENIDLLFEKKIIIFGASSAGKRVYHYLKFAGIDIYGFCDNDAQKWAKLIEGKRVYSLNELLQLEIYNNMLIIVASAYFKEIIEQIKITKVWERPVCTWTAIQYGLQFCDDSKLILEDKKKLIKGSYEIWRSIHTKKVELHNLHLVIDTLCGRNPVLVLHPGKVGSSSVYKSLVDLGLDAFQWNDFYYNVNCTECVEQKQLLFDFYKSKNEIKIISLVREPIARDISYFFQSTFSDAEWHVKNRLSNNMLEDCKKILLDYTVDTSNIKVVYDWLDYLAVNGKYGTEFDWFDYELKAMFGIDVYSVPFDKKKGYQIYSKDNVSVLLLKMEKLNELENVIGKFVGSESFKLHNSNVGREKNYRYMYEELKEKLVLPREYFEFYYKNNEKFNWFYSEEERNQFSQKWKCEQN